MRLGVRLVAFQGAFPAGGLQAFRGEGLQAFPGVARGAVAREGVGHEEEQRQQKVENLEAGARGEKSYLFLSLRCLIISRQCNFFPMCVRAPLPIFLLLKHQLR